MKNILVVDNNQMMLDFMSDLLAHAGHTVETAENGLAALDVLQAFTPEIIFIDLVMPKIDGRQLLRILKSHDEYKNIITVVLSAIAAEERYFGFPEQADACIAKMPFKAMKDAVLELIGEMEAGRKARYRGHIIGVDKLYKRDITEELLVSHHHHEMLFASITDGFFEITPDNKIVYANKAAFSLTGTTENTVLAREFSSLFQEPSRRLVKETVESIGETPREIGENEPIILLGKRLLIRFIPLKYGDHRSVIAIMQDITKRKKAEELIRESLKQKETLLKEIHHRVKNNLQIVASLLSLQSRLIHDEKIEHYFQESQNRVAAMALIHQQLYESVDLSGIRLDSYLQDLIAQLIHTYGDQNRVVRTAVTVPDIPISIETAVPLGLIVNELITNSLIHGINRLKNEETEGRIELTITEQEGPYTLTVKDNGPGIPKEVKSSPGETLGLSLVESLAQQLNGGLSFENDNGAVAVVSFYVT